MKILKIILLIWLLLFILLVLWIKNGAEKEREARERWEAEQRRIYTEKIVNADDFFARLAKGYRDKKGSMDLHIGAWRIDSQELFVDDDKLRQILIDKNIEGLSADDMPERVGGKFSFTRTEPDELYQPNEPKNTQELLDLYHKRNEQLQECDTKYQLEYFYCFRDSKPIWNETNYYYFPSQSKQLPHIKKPIKIMCEFQNYPDNPKHICEINTRLSSPYNARIWFYFGSPKADFNSKYFFYKILYIEQIIFEATGEHIWDDKY